MAEIIRMALGIFVLMQTVLFGFFSVVMFAQWVRGALDDLNDLPVTQTAALEYSSPVFKASLGPDYSGKGGQRLTASDDSGMSSLVPKETRAPSITEVS